MVKLTLKQAETLANHSKHQSKKHMDMMKKLMREGKTFKQAHTAAQKQVGKRVYADGLTRNGLT